MYVPEKMKHNAFKAVRVPTPQELFGRVGYRPVNPSGFTGDESLHQQSKLDMIREENERVLADLRAKEDAKRNSSASD